MNTELHLTVEEPELRAISGLVTDNGSLSFDRWLSGPHGIQVWIKPMKMQKSIGAGDRVVDLLLSIPPGIAASLVASWLFERLRGRAKRLRIERTEIQIEEGEIRRVVHEYIERG